MKKNNQIFYEKDSLNNLNLYFKDLRKSKVITKEEEIILSERIKNGDEDAVKSLVEANLKFVVTIAKEYQNQGLPINDLINEGNYGLLKAAKKFDHTMGFRFISYAVWWVRQSIINSLNENARTVRLPTNVINRLSNLNKEILKELKKYDNFNYENEELTNEAEHLGLSVYNQNKSLNCWSVASTTVAAAVPVKVVLHPVADILGAVPDIIFKSALCKRLIGLLYSAAKTLILDKASFTACCLLSRFSPAFLSLQ